MRPILTKRRKEIEKLRNKHKLYNLADAIDILKKVPGLKFDETVELSMKLTLNPKDSSHMVRGTVVLPHGTGKKIRVAVFCKDEDEDRAKQAGADYAGAEELIKKVSGGWCDFDVAIATPNMMRDIAKLGRILGPRGLMPNPKVGTVTENVEKAIKEVKSGKIEFKMDKQAGIHIACGKVSFDKQALIENITSAIKAILGSNPLLNRPQSIKSVSVSTTMGPGIKLDIAEFRR